MLKPIDSAVRKLRNKVNVARIGTLSKTAESERLIYLFCLKNIVIIIRFSIKLCCQGCIEICVADVESI